MAISTVAISTVVEGTVVEGTVAEGEKVPRRKRKHCNTMLSSANICVYMGERERRGRGTEIRERDICRMKGDGQASTQGNIQPLHTIHLHLHLDTFYTSHTPL